MSESGRPRRTRSSLSSSTVSTTPNPYKKPTYLVGGGGGGGGGGRSSSSHASSTPAESPEDSLDSLPPTLSTPEGLPVPKKKGRPFGSLSKNHTPTPTPAKSTPTSSRGVTTNESRGRGGGGGRGGRRNTNSSTPSLCPVITPLPTSTPTSSSTPSSGRGRRRTAAPPPALTPKSRPECFRAESGRRKSGGGGGRGRKRRRGGYSTTDYHYGSDFESDHYYESEGEGEKTEEEEEEEELGNDLGLDEGLDCDIELSSEPLSARLSALSSIPVPLWMDEGAQLEELEIPRSSDDLLLPREHVVAATAVYEPLRRFSNLVRLTPFRFEDFCGALVSEEQSVLLVEIHIQLLKALIREDEATGTSFGPNECKDSVQSVLFFIDNLTWAECLRSYLESDADWKETLETLNSVEYPYCGPGIRLKILNWLVSTFLLTSGVRDALTNEGNILHEDYCRSCNRLGELICCETCPAVYHISCTNLPSGTEVPDAWTCPICKAHDIPGVAECASDIEKAGLLLRHEILGYDRHGRKYWFLVRRILVESDDFKDVWYYSTPLQVEELLCRLDGENYEKELVENILSLKEEIFRQMSVTEKVTAKMNASHRKTYLEAENTFLQRIHAEREEIKRQEAAERAKLEEEAREAKRKEEEERGRAEEEERARKEEEKRKIREERLAKRNKVKLEKRLGGVIDESLLHLLNEDSGDEQNITPSKTNSVEELKTLPLENGEPITEGEIKEENKEDVDSTQGKEDKKDDGVHNEESKLQNGTDEKMETEKIESEIKVENMETDDEIVETSKSSESKIEESKEKEDVKMDETVEEGVKIGPNLNSEPKPEIKTEELYTKIPPLPQFVAKSKSLCIEVDSEERTTRLRSTGLYKLGSEGSHRSYVNKFSTDLLALSKTQHSEERDKRRVMSHKFSLTPASECKWSGTTTGLRLTTVTTLRSTLLAMENGVPSTLLHTNWGQLRKAWITAVTGCSTASEFSKALLALSSALRPAIFNPIWSEGAGHVKIQRLSAAEKELRKKIEKRDKKERDDEEDRLKLLPQAVHYSILPKHQVWKQKGEEYRLHGRSGWIWLSSFRPASPSDARTLGLATGPKKHVVQFKNHDGVVRTAAIEPDVYEKLMLKRLQNQASPTKGAGSEEAEIRLVMDKMLAEIVSQEESEKTKVEDSGPIPLRKFRLDLVNVSQGLASGNRILYSKLVPKVKVLDSLLERRTKLGELEEKGLLADYSKDMIEKARKEGDNIVEEDKGEIIVPIDGTFPLAGGLAYCCYSRECQTELEKGSPNYESRCYSPMCRLKYVIMDGRRKKLENLRKLEFEKSKKIREDIIKRTVYNVPSTTSKIFLKRTLPPKEPPVKFPKTSKFVERGKGRLNVLVLAQHELKKIARTGGRVVSPAGFAANPKPNSWLWPYPCGRPFFKTTWQFKSVSANSLSAAAFQLRILYALVRWDDIHTKPPSLDGKSQLMTDMEVITSEILEHRILGRFQEIVQYLRRRHIVPIDAPKTIREVTPSRSGLRKRKKAETEEAAAPEVREEWVDEDKFEVWELRLYGEKLERRALSERKVVVASVGPTQPPSSLESSPTTRTKTGTGIKVPEKWDPSPKEKEKENPGPESRVAHVSKRDNHAKIVTPVSVTKTLTASQQVLEQAASKGSGNMSGVTGVGPVIGVGPSSQNVGGSTVKVSGSPMVTKKFFVSKQGQGTPAGSTPPTKAGILTRKPIGASPSAPLNKTGSISSSSTTSTTTSTSSTPVHGTALIKTAAGIQQVQLSPAGQKVTVVRLADGKMQVRGLLPGQQAVQTNDGKVHVFNQADAVDATPSPSPSIIGTPTRASPIRMTLGGGSNLATHSSITPVPTVLSTAMAAAGLNSSTIKTGVKFATEGKNVNANVNANNAGVAPTPTPTPAHPVKKVVKKVSGATVVRVNKTLEELKVSPLRLQVGENVIVVTWESVTKGANGENQIVLGPNLPILTLLPSKIETPVQVVQQEQKVQSVQNVQGPNISNLTRINVNVANGGQGTPQNAQVGQTVQNVQNVQQVQNVQNVNIGGGQNVVQNVALPQNYLNSAVVKNLLQQQQGLMAEGGSGLSKEPVKIVIKEGGKQYILDGSRMSAAQVEQFTQMSSKQNVVAPTPISTVVQTPQVFRTISTGAIPARFIIQQGSGDGIGSLPPGQRFVILKPGTELGSLTSPQFLTKITNVAPTHLRPVGPVVQQQMTPQIIPTQQPNYVRPVMASTPLSIGTSSSVLSQGKGPEKLPISIVSPSKIRVGGGGQVRASFQQQQPTEGIMTSQQLAGLLQQSGTGLGSQALRGVKPIRLGGPSSQTVINSLIGSSSSNSLISSTTTTGNIEEAASVLEAYGTTVAQGVGLGQGLNSTSTSNTPTFNNTFNSTLLTPKTIPTPSRPTILQKNLIRAPSPAKKITPPPPHPPPTTTTPAPAPAPTQTQTSSESKVTATVETLYNGAKALIIRGVDLNMTPIQKEVMKEQIIKVLLTQKSLDLDIVNNSFFEGEVELAPKLPIVTPPPPPHTQNTTHVAQGAPPIPNIDYGGNNSILNNGTMGSMSSIGPKGQEPVVFARKSLPGANMRAKSPVKRLEEGDLKSIDESIEAAIESVMSSPPPPPPPPHSPKRSPSPGKKKKIEEVGVKFTPLPPQILPPTTTTLPLVQHQAEELCLPEVAETIEVETTSTLDQIFEDINDLLSVETKKAELVETPTISPTPKISRRKSPIAQLSPKSQTTISPKNNINEVIASVPFENTNNIVKNEVEERESEVKIEKKDEKITNVVTETGMSRPPPPAKMLASIYRHKEQLKKDIILKRELLEKEIRLAAKEEIDRELGRKAEALGSSENVKQQTEPPSFTAQALALQNSKKRKSNENNVRTPPPHSTPKKRRGSGKRGARGDKKSLSCICKSEYDPSKFYVSCSSCGSQFHGECVAISDEEMLRSVGGEWYCSPCSSRTEGISPVVGASGVPKGEEGLIYCICKKPYASDKFYIQCDGCEDWFHGACVGILPTEGPKIKQYICPNCDDRTPLNWVNFRDLKNDDYADLSRLIRYVKEHRMSGPFLEPVKEEEAKDYYKLIRDPMDLKTIEMRVEQKWYTKFCQFIGDMGLMFENCRMYNPASHKFNKQSRILESFFIEKLKLLREKYEHD